MDLPAPPVVPDKEEGRYVLKERETPETFPDVYPERGTARVPFDGVARGPKPAADIWVADSTFCEGQEGRRVLPPEACGRILGGLARLGGTHGALRETELAVAEVIDRESVETCRARSHTFPELTARIEGTGELKQTADLGFKEVGFPVPVSDAAIYGLYGSTRKGTVESVMSSVKKVREAGLVPRCHLDGITRADLYGMVVPMVRDLVAWAERSDIPVKIRLCDPEGLGVPFATAAAPRGVPAIVSTLIAETGLPSEWLEWCGSDREGLGLANAQAAWLHGCACVVGTLGGIGRDRNMVPIERLLVAYAGLRGDANGSRPDDLEPGELHVLLNPVPADAGAARGFS